MESNGDPEFIWHADICAAIGLDSSIELTPESFVNPRANPEEAILWLSVPNEKARSFFFLFIFIIIIFAENNIKHLWAH